MKLSPLSIKNQEFTKGMRGFDVDEVRTYLEKLADEVEKLQVENDSLQLEVENLKNRLNEFMRIEKNLQDTLLKAQESSSRAVESTKKQTGLMIKEAELKATQIIERARENANDIRDAVINLREEKDLLISKLKAIVTSQSDLLGTKVADAGEEPTKRKQIESPDKIDVNVDEVVSKIS